MTMSTWTAFPYPAEPFRQDLPTLRRRWPRLHLGDAEPWPENEAVQQAWALLHAGEFQAAATLGLQAGAAGVNVANRAQCLYAHYLEPHETDRLLLLMEVAERATALTGSQPDNANAWYAQAYSLGRYSQCISVAKALSQGLGQQIREALQTVLRLQPRHADAHFALGTFHAEVIDKLGTIAARAQGADSAQALRSFRMGLQLHPHSAIGRLEYARGLLLLEGDARLPDADALYREAAALEPADAVECLDVERARAEIDD